MGRSEGAKNGMLRVIFDAVVDGWRCAARHSVFWRLPVFFSLAHGLFPVLCFWLSFYWVRGEWPPLPEMGVTGGLPTGLPWGTLAWRSAEATGAVFSNIFPTFPLAAIFAFGVLIYWRGCHGCVRRELALRFGRPGRCFHFMLLAGAVATLGKLLWYVGLPEWHRRFSGGMLWQIGVALDSFAFVFEFALGLWLQTWLFWLAVIWIRGISFTSGKFRRFVSRRAVRVLPWAVCLLIPSWLLLYGPGLLAALSGRLPEHAPGWNQWARCLLALGMIAFGMVQMRLVFTNGRLASALGFQWNVLKRKGGVYAGYCIWMAVMFFLLHLGFKVMDGMVEGDFLKRSLKALENLGAAALSGWMVAGAVCLYRRGVTGRREAT